MLNKEQMKIIDEYVEEKYYDKKKLLKYLEMHTIVGNEIFQYCDKRINGEDRATYSEFLNEKFGYQPLSTSKFIKRIPFYFYTVDLETLESENMGCLHYILSSSVNTDFEAHDLEKIYQALEYMFYELKLPLNKIFNYWINQFGIVSNNVFMEWNHYLHICQELGNDNYFPERFITAYNIVLEKSNLEPIIYEISERYFSEAYFRRGNILEFEGVFPCDELGEPILRWIGISVKNAKKNNVCISKIKKRITEN